MGQRSKGPWTVRGTARKYQNPWIDVCEDAVIRPDGSEGSYATVRMKPGVSVLAFDAEGLVYLTSEYRYAVERDSVEVVSGGIDEGEAPIDAARRELREELGFEAEEWVALGAVDPFTSIIHSPAHLFVARGLRSVGIEREATEVIQTFKVKLDEAVGMVLDGRVTHGPSCVLILKAAFVVRNDVEE